ncbi:hypothetical protein B7494_g1530 [Chlorociboria aeruginascens]|nr:hypothetical protein B7494_g1530 [Chlorociboria aeruginascens]
MKSAFGSKRKPRKIQVDEEDDGVAKDTQGSVGPVSTPISGAPVTSNPGRKSFKKSSLRQSIVFDDLIQDGDTNDTEGSEVGLPSLNKSMLGRSSSLNKKKGSSSRLSFGPGEIISGDAAEALEDDETFTLKKPTLGRRVMETNALRKNIPIKRLPLRAPEDDNERPTYSKDYLNELKSSTPSTPKDIRSLNMTIEDEDGLDASELDGAMVVDLTRNIRSGTEEAAIIPTEAEIREKKERRARLAHEEDFISLTEDDNDRRQLSLLRKKKPETRLVREDEDLGEGFDEFVDDGHISLGKKQEREARRRQRKEMADMIQQAEGSSDEESDDSEAERRAAYEAAQTRAGMDGLVKPDENLKEAAIQVPPRITPLPVLSGCLERLQSTLATMKQELDKKHRQMAGLEKEKSLILTREAEVPELLKEAGARYSALKADLNLPVGDTKLLIAAHDDLTESRNRDRGLESFGNTPTIRPEVEDVG